MQRLMIASLLLVLLTACAPAAPSLEQIAGPVSQTLAAMPTASAYPTYTPYPTLAPLPTYTSAPTLEPVEVEIVVTATVPVVEDSEVEQARSKITDGVRAILEVYEVPNINVLRWDSDNMEVEAKLPYASAGNVASMHYDLATIMALLFDPTSNFAPAYTDDTHLIFTTYSAGGDYKFVSSMSMDTLQKMNADQLSYDEWVVEAGFPGE